MVIRLVIGIIKKNNSMLINNINIILKSLILTSIILYIINSIYIYSNYDAIPSYLGFIAVILLIVSILVINKLTTTYLVFYILLLIFLNFTPNILDNKIMETLYYTVDIKFDIDYLFPNNNFIGKLFSWYFKNLNLIVSFFLLLFEIPYRLIFKNKKILLKDRKL